MDVLLNKKNVILLIIIACLVIFLFLPIKLPYTITVPGKIIPAKEWIISKGADGRLISMLVDYERGNSQNYSVNLFERGDAVKFTLNSNITAGCKITSLDTVGHIYSNEIERQIVRLKGELAATKALLLMSMSGEKESILSEAQQQLNAAKMQDKMQQIILKRQEELFKRKLISQEEFENEQTKSKIYNANVGIAEAKLQTVLSGAKNEQIGYIQSQVKALEQEILIYEKRFSDFNLISPISGTACRVFSGDTLLIVKDTTYVIFLPIEWRNRHYIKVKQDVELKIPDVNVNLKATILELGKNVRTINGNQVMIATAIIKGDSGELAPGLVVQSSIKCGYISPREYLIRFWKSFLA